MMTFEIEKKETGLECFTRWSNRFFVLSCSPDRTKLSMSRCVFLKSFQSTDLPIRWIILCKQRNRTYLFHRVVKLFFLLSCLQDRTKLSMIRYTFLESFQGTHLQRKKRSRMFCWVVKQVFCSTVGPLPCLPDKTKLSISWCIFLESFHNTYLQKGEFIPWKEKY